MRPFSMQTKEHVRMSVPNNTKWPSVKKLQQNIIKFPYTQYPFPNQSVPADLFNTMVQCSINQKKIQKIVNFKCDNIINLKKIVKIKMRDKKQQSEQKSERSKPIVSAYSFYYEKVEYSLGHVLQSRSQKNVFLVNKFNLDRAQIKKTLANVIALLYKEGIISFLEFQQIGVSEQGVIKVYIAPHVLFDQCEYNPKTKVLVIKYLNDVLREIDAKFPKSLKTKNSIETIRSHQDLSIEKDLIESEESFFVWEKQEKKDKRNEQNVKDKRKELYQNVEKSLDQEEDNFFVASGSTNLDHIKLHKEMKKKFQNHKLASKADEIVKSQRKSRILTKLQQQHKINELTLQLQQIRRKIRQKAQEKRDKNIYASKVFKTMATEDKTQPRQQQQHHDFQHSPHPPNQPKHRLNPYQLQTKLNTINRKRKTSLSSINFYNGILPHHKNINCINIYHPKDYCQKSYLHCRDDAMSVDTYEMEIGDDYRMPKISVSLGMRNSLSPNKARESVKVSPKRKEGDKSQTKARFYESAGGKSFQHIMTLLKPQFQPKKSNIFEQPQFENEEDSFKKSISLKKSFGRQPSEHSSLEKPQIKINPRNLSPEQNIVSQKSRELKTIDIIKNDIKNIMNFKTVNQSPVTPRNSPLQRRQTLPMQRDNSKNPQLQLMYLRQTQHKPKQKQRQSDILVKKSILEQKVKKAMERTKKAIDVLNQVKIRQVNSGNLLNQEQM